MDLKEVLEAVEPGRIVREEDHIQVFFKGSFGILSDFLNIAGYKWNIDYDLDNKETFFIIKLISQDDFKYIKSF